VIEPAIEVVGLGKRYRRRWALQDCSLSIPRGKVAGIVGANGAGKSTLLQLIVGLLGPSAGSVRVLGDRAGDQPGLLARVGFLAQDAPLYARLRVKDHLTMGQHMNPGWDHAFALDRINALKLDLGQRAGSLSGGQRAQLALTVAVAKRPELLVLDEPVAGLDPLARREFLRTLMTVVNDHQVTVLLSSHLLSDIERVCDYVVILSEGRVQLVGDVDELLATHRVLSGPSTVDDLPNGVEVITSTRSERQTTAVVRFTGQIFDQSWSAQPLGLEELVLAYLGFDLDPDADTLDGPRSAR
jgi:ABC-2 type transport system ATP-binding protein